MVLSNELLISRQHKYAISLVNLSEEEARLRRQLKDIEEQVAMTRGAMAELATLLREETDADGNQTGQ